MIAVQDNDLAPDRHDVEDGTDESLEKQLSRRKGR